MRERVLIYDEGPKPLSQCSTEHLLYARDTFSERNNATGEATVEDLRNAIEIELLIRQRNLR